MRVPAGVTISAPLIDRWRPSFVAHQSPSMTSAQARPLASRTDARAAKPSKTVSDRGAIACILSHDDAGEHNANPSGPALALSDGTTYSEEHLDRAIVPARRGRGSDRHRRAARRRV